VGQAASLRGGWLPPLFSGTATKPIIKLRHT
jgi:hypothetical protein